MTDSQIDAPHVRVQGEEKTGKPVASVTGPGAVTITREAYLRFRRRKQ
jgi:hypothetical protein